MGAAAARDRDAWPLECQSRKASYPKFEPPVTRRISTMTTGFQAPTKALVIVEVSWWCSGAGGILPARPAQRTTWLSSSIASAVAVPVGRAADDGKAVPTSSADQPAEQHPNNTVSR
jgi:hypothetical protein